MAKIDVINRLVAIVAGVFTVNQKSTVDELEKLENELAAIPNFSESELAKAITNSIAEEKKAVESALSAEITDLQSKIVDLESVISELNEKSGDSSQSEAKIVELNAKVSELENTISELNESLASAEESNSTVKTLKPTFKHEKKTYEVLSGCRMMIDKVPVDLTAEDIAKNKEAQAILVSKNSGVINKLEG